MSERSLIILSHFQVKPLLAGRARGETTLITSPDLGLSTVEVRLDAAGVLFPAGDRLAWADAEAVAGNDNGCFALHGGEIEKIQTFSEATGRPISLMPTAGPPTLLIAGFPMHRIKGTDPGRDTLSKVRALAPVTGRALDTSTGLGYTAIEMAETAAEVVTVELDPGVLEIARLNPYSRALFERSTIRQVMGDSFEVVTGFPSAAFDVILHDPPTFSLAGDLYSGEFYRELYRILAPRGRLFHYIGDLESDSGRRVSRGALERLQAAGFRRVARRNEAFGLLAAKG
ncbi:MAG: methyltransferase domain-containing protein [Anaerolineae bacterium]|nr:methyltransferase domain-containing protein [Anaerolineae bacterium]